MQTWKNMRSSCKGLASTVCLMNKWKHYVFVLAIAMVWASTRGFQSCVSIRGTKDHLPASKVVTWSTLPWLRRCFICLIYLCRNFRRIFCHKTFLTSQCLSYRVFFDYFSFIFPLAICSPGRKKIKQIRILHYLLLKRIVQKHMLLKKRTS